MTAPPALLAVFAHPDDEAFGVGGTLSRYAAAGHPVYVVTATRGEAGQIAVPELGVPAGLPALRERELRCACQQYGIHPPLFLDYQDGHLTTVHQGQAVGKLVRLIRELRPAVLVTFGPEGIYGHYDHLAVHRWATIAFDLAADPTFLPDPSFGQPYQPTRLYYNVLAQEALEARRQNGQRPAVLMDGVPFAFSGLPLEQISTVIDVGDYAEAKLRGILCHASQIGRQNRFVESPDEVLQDPWFRRETFLLARTSVSKPPGVETDLFAGLE